MKSSNLANAFDQDPGYNVTTPFVDIYDVELSEDQKFKKYLFEVFPVKIAKEIFTLYPDFKVDYKTKLRKMVGSSAFFYGAPGTGKSFMACILVLLSKRKSWYYLHHGTKFYTVADLLDHLRELIRLRNDIDQDNGLSLYDSLIDKLKNYRYLVLDDFGAEKSTEYSLEVLDRIIDARYQNNKVTIITTNLSVEYLIKKSGYERMMSRLMDMVQGRPVSLTKVYRKLEIDPIKF